MQFVADTVPNQSNSSENYYEQEWNMSAESVTTPTKCGQRLQGAKQNINTCSPTSSKAADIQSRGRISRLKPKEEISTFEIIDVQSARTSEASQLAYESIMDSVQSHTLSPLSGAIKTTSDSIPAQDSDKQAQRFPIIDSGKPFVCQQCGLSFAREKALLSHGKVGFLFFKSRFNDCILDFSLNNYIRRNVEIYLNLINETSSISFCY